MLSPRVAPTFLPEQGVLGEGPAQAQGQHTGLWAAWAAGSVPSLRCGRVLAFSSVGGGAGAGRIPGSSSRGKAELTWASPGHVLCPLDTAGDPRLTGPGGRAGWSREEAGEQLPPWPDLPSTPPPWGVAGHLLDKKVPLQGEGQQAAVRGAGVWMGPRAWPAWAPAWVWGVGRSRAPHPSGQLGAPVPGHLCS